MAMARPEETGDAKLAVRMRALVRALAKRGFTMEIGRLATLLRTDPVRLRGLANAAGLVVERGHVAPRSHATLIGPSFQRAAGHAEASAAWRPVAAAYARSLARHVPWVKVILLSGSVASGGFSREDDLDVSLVVADGTKHLSYLACLALTIPFAWKHRRRPHGPEARLPFFPKLLCVNVVWTEAETRPFVRTDEAMAIELALSVPIWGAARWGAMLEANAWLPYQPSRPEEIPRVRSSPMAALLRRLPTRPLNAASYHLAQALHAWVRWYRREDPETRTRVARLEASKHPYAILDRPAGRA